MLTEFDKQFILDTRKDIDKGRQVEVILEKRTVIKEDFLTGANVYGIAQIKVLGVMSTYSTETSGKKNINYGFKEEKDVIKVDFQMDVDLTDVATVLLGSKRYVITYNQPKGLGGQPNRQEVTLKLTKESYNV